MGVYRVEVPEWHPASDNLLHRNWWTRLDCKRRDAEMVRGYALSAQVSKATGRRRVSVTLEYSTRSSWMDPQNAMKSLLDALVSAGLLVDDSQPHLELGLWQCLHSGRTATVIVLEDLES